MTGLLRYRLFVVFLWMAVMAWGAGLGAKLFEFRVVISAWAANPPESLSLLPYGARYPNNPGDFFMPLSILLAVATIGTLVCGNRMPRDYKVWLWVPLVSLLVIWIATPTLFWPMIGDLYGAGTGSRPLDEAAAQALVNRWLLLDWGRTAFIALGFVSTIRAMGSIPSAAAPR